MIEIEKKNKRTIDIALHIPLPSIRIRLTGEDEEKIENVPLQHQAPAKEDHESQD